MISCPDSIQIMGTWIDVATAVIRGTNDTVVQLGVPSSAESR